jgi:thymidylate synthase
MEQQYLDLLRKLLDDGEERQTRNSVTRSLFSAQLKFDLAEGFPLLTSKKMFFRGVFEELMFFLRGDTDTKKLEDKGVRIWAGNTSRAFLDSVGLERYREGDMGPMYGFNLRHFGAEYKGCDSNYSGCGFDQLQYVIDTILTEPHSRRILMTVFNPARAHEGCLYPCHSIVVQFYVSQRGGKYYVSEHMYQRSVDTVCGLPFNIASSALLLEILCHHLNAIVGAEMYYADTLTLSLGDYHLYEPHYDVARTQIERKPYPFPKLKLRATRENIEDYQYEDVELIGYQCHPALKAEMVC